MELASSRAIAASEDAVWSVVSDPARLPEWLPTVAGARGGPAGTVELEGESHGHPYRVASQWKADPAARALEWAGSDDGEYRGSLRVGPAPGGQALVRVEVVVPDERLAHYSEGEPELRRGLEEALDRLSALVGP